MYRYALCTKSTENKANTRDKKRPSAKQMKNQNTANFLLQGTLKKDFPRIVSCGSLLTSMRCKSQELVQVNIFSWIWPRRFRSSEKKKILHIPVRALYTVLFRILDKKQDPKSEDKYEVGICYDFKQDLFPQ